MNMYFSRKSLVAATVALGFAILPAAVFGAEEPPELKAAVESGKLPPLAERLPETPRVIDMEKLGKTEGKYGGKLRMLMSRSKDIRMMTVYGYARLVGFGPDLQLAPDILQDVDVEEGRIFTLRLRPGHKWSDGHPFTSEDFRYYWEDVATNPDISRSGPRQVMLVAGKPPKFEVVDEVTVRYTWDKPNPLFLPSLAGARPNYIYLPSHYMRQFHAKYADAGKLEAAVKAAGSRNWVALHTVKARQYRPENPDLPTLEPWANRTAPPAERFVFERNPYFHRVDKSGRQLPYIDSILMGISSKEIIAAKTGTGETDLQGRYLRFDDYTFLKGAEKSHNIKVLLWENGVGSQMALLPNLNVEDAGWREVLRDVRFRRALSLGIHREEINQQFFFGLAYPSSNSVLPDSPLFKTDYSEAWAGYDPERANAMLDEMGLTKRNGEGIRLLPDGRPAELIVESAGATEEADLLQLISVYWKDLGIKVFVRTLQRDVLRRRFLTGQTMMSVWGGLNVGLASADLPPEELAPVSSAQGNWPVWGQHTETGGQAGQAIDDPEAAKLLELYQQWRLSATHEDRESVWHEMLTLYSDQVYTIGTVNGVKQPIVFNGDLRNTPEKGVYAFSPTAYFGIYMPDTFWFDKGASN